ncbi:hypothetical protein DVH24_000150 [Malus domestica]|uniref:Uncharacterized protein n=1 Tax=Malus domestica TaxID=3750 RepID=A0A498J513_MALDO|nr:hypothetical protein DVH24_000150 [Malus domestica]
MVKLLLFILGWDPPGFLKWGHQKQCHFEREREASRVCLARQGKAAGEAETDASFRTVVNTKVQAWQEEVDRARQGQRDAEGKLSFLEEHMELEKRYRELTDLLYLSASFIVFVPCCTVSFLFLHNFLGPGIHAD